MSSKNSKKAALTLGLSLLSLPALAQEWKPVGLLRVRQEGFQWFRPTTPDRQDAYALTGVLLRAGAVQKRSDGQVRLEVAVPSLFDLPTRATAPSPAGSLGPGGNLRNLNGSQNGGFFLKQAFREFKISSDSLARLGRFEFGDGRDVVPKDAALAWAKDQRLADRLLGSLGGTPVGRSFDGASYTRTRGARTLTALVASPTRGVFDLDGQETLSHVKAAYVGQTQATPTSESRVFSMWYEDTRGNTRKTDNATTTDSAPIRLLTLGGSVMGVKQTASGPLDGALWGALQGGSWGRQTARAASMLGEVGWRPDRAKGRLWLRAGRLWCSGDGDPGDTVHGTFYPLLVAPKLYARPPFYAFANVDDTFLTVRHLSRKDFSARLEWHCVSLANGRDLWYQGFGPYARSGNFGLSGRPSGGKLALGDLTDLALDWNPSPTRQVSLHLGHTRGRDVVRTIFPRGDAWFGFLEVTRRW